MEEGPEMALRRWNLVTVEAARGRLFPRSRFIIQEDEFGGDFENR